MDRHKSCNYRIMIQWLICMLYVYVHMYMGPILCLPWLSFYLHAMFVYFLWFKPLWSACHVCDLCLHLFLFLSLLYISFTSSLFYEGKISNSTRSFVVVIITSTSRLRLKRIINKKLWYHLVYDGIVFWFIYLLSIFDN